MHHVSLARVYALAFGLLVAGVPAIALAQPSSTALPAAQQAAQPARRLPADVTTHHVVDLPGRTLKFAATAGSVTLTDAAGLPQAQISFISYMLDDADPQKRPISFAFNGGPGSASLILHLGLLGPWRMAMQGEAVRPSAPPVPEGNADTWLDFTDLVFIDPIGTGYSRLLVNSEENRKKYWSVGGDVTSIAEMIRRTVTTAHRLVSPKYIIGESYGGLRGPRLVRALTSDEGIGINGLVMVSPKFDYGGSTVLAPLTWVAQLPTIVASERAKSGPVTRGMMADVEAYAAGDYLRDLIRGEADPAAVMRRIDRVASLTGLDRALLERRHGRVTNGEFLRERSPGEVASAYDTTITKPDPFPQSEFSNFPNPLTDALDPPFVSAMIDLYTRRLNWQPEGGFVSLSRTVNRSWDLGSPLDPPQSLSALRTALALDPSFRVLIGHGLFDVVTPYFMTQMELDQIPASVSTGRVRFEVYPGGHMFYTQDASRAAFRDAALALYTQR